MERLTVCSNCDGSVARFFKLDVPAKSRHSREGRDFKAAHNFTLKANIVKKTSDGVRHIQDLTAFM